MNAQLTTEQEAKVDSLKQIIVTTKHDTTSIKTYLNIGYIYKYVIPDTALYFYNKALKLSQKVSNKKFESKSLNYIGIFHQYMGNYSKAIKYYLKSLKICEELDDKKEMANCYYNIGIIHTKQGNFEKAIEYYLGSIKIRKEIGDRNGISASYNNIGIVYENQGNYDKAIEYYLRSLKIREEIVDRNGISASYGNIGNVHWCQGNYDNAIEYYLKALKIFEEIGNKNGIFACYGNIGVIHKNQGNYDKAIEYFLKSLKITEEIGDKNGMSNCYNNIGVIYNVQGNNDKAIEYYLKSLKIVDELGDKKGMSNRYCNIGIVHMGQGNYDKAIEYFLKSLKITEEIGDKNGTAISYGNIANLQIMLADSTALSERQRSNYLNKAVEYGNKAYNLALEIDAVPQQNNAAAYLQKAYTKLGRYKEAIKYAEIYITTQDSMFSEEKTKALAEMGTKYETEKKQLQIEKMGKQKELDNKTIEVQKAENRKQLIIIISAIIGFIIVLVFSIILLRMFSQKRKANILLAEQKAEIEEKNRDIMDSITYAKRIQLAILPPSKIVKEYLKDSFILYKPKDIVAGDFYWMEHKDGKILFAAADCTGHGVPGAMVSVVCNNGLNRSVREYGLTDPGKILDKTREIVIQEFEKSEEEVKDGMDIAICSLEGNRLQYAGAHNPLWIIRKGEILETKADRQPIGKSRLSEPFTTHTIELQKDDTLYIFSDGYVDQFGGENGKKFKSKAFKDLLLSIQIKTMEEQRILLDNNFESWRGKIEQIDDVCIIGVKI